MRRYSGARTIRSAGEPHREAENQSIREPTHFPWHLCALRPKGWLSGAAVSIWLIWKDTEMPDKAIRDRDLANFKAELANVLDWETAQVS